MKRQLSSKTSSSSAVGIVVRRGARRRFDALKEKTADLPAVVTWDRRQMDRRASAQPAEIDQRKTERRREPPFTWEVADFVVLEGPAPKSALAFRRAETAAQPTDRKKRV
jgi:hypothetical protein